MDDEALLALWEEALDCDGWRREDLLVAAATGGELPTSLGERNVALLRWRRRWCGRALALRATCPHCAAELDLELDSEALCERGDRAPGPVELHVGERRLTLRLPTIDDVRALASLHLHVESLAAALLERCVTVPGGDGPRVPMALDEELRAAAAKRLETLDPTASLGATVRCEACGRTWDAPLDPVRLLWPELRRRAEQVLIDVAALGRAYGWAERDVLRMGATRRRAYLQLAGAA